MWVRFHSLPGSKRYADSREEAADILTRHHVLPVDLGLTERCFVSTSWYDQNDASGLTLTRAPDIHPTSQLWRPVAPEPGEAGTSLHASLENYPSANVDDLMSKVTEEAISGMMILPPDGACIYRPYDGGADVFAQSPAHRDRLANRHRAWLSPDPSGR